MSFLVRAVWPILFFQITANVQAGLQWEDRFLQKTWSFGQEEEDFVFKFKNTGSYPVEVRQVTSSCGCTTAKISQKSFKPGEAGEIRAVFKAAGRVGLQEKHVDVLTDDENESLTRLTLRTKIPGPVTLAPRLLAWKVGEAPIQKICRIGLHPKSGLEWISEDLSCDEYTVRSKQEEKGQIFIVVRPRTTEKANSRDLVINFRTSTGGKVSKKVFLRIRPEINAGGLR